MIRERVTLIKIYHPTYTSYIAVRKTRWISATAIRKARVQTSSIRKKKTQWLFELRSVNSFYTIVIHSFCYKIDGSSRESWIKLLFVVMPKQNSNFQRTLSYCMFISMLRCIFRFISLFHNKMHSKATFFFSNWSRLDKLSWYISKYHLKLRIYFKTYPNRALSKKRIKRKINRT